LKKLLRCSTGPSRPTESSCGLIPRSGTRLGPDEPTAFYNYACFCAQTGREEECREYLRKAIILDRSYNSIAATDEDLSAYRHTDWFEELVSFKKRR
jgi:hypothetical protein